MSRLVGRAMTISLMSSGMEKRMSVAKVVHTMLRAWLRRLGLRQARFMMMAPGGREGGEEGGRRERGGGEEWEEGGEEWEGGGEGGRKGGNSS